MFYRSVICHKLFLVVRIIHHKEFTRSLTARKRFYKNVTVIENGGKFEICLDKRKLKTPCGNIFQVPSEPLAIGVAMEWLGQYETINLHTMHLTGLCNTVLDNPLKHNDNSLVETVLNCLETDTICFRTSEPYDFIHLQETDWDPVLQWFNKSFDVELLATNNITGPEIKEHTKETIRRHLSSYNFWSLTGFCFAVDAIKSVVLTLAAVQRHLSIEDSVRLSRLETEFQIKHWGNVEWAHDLDLMDTRSRLSAAVLFIHLNGENSRIMKTNNVQN